MERFLYLFIFLLPQPPVEQLASNSGSVLQSCTFQSTPATGVLVPFLAQLGLLAMGFIPSQLGL